MKELYYPIALKMKGRRVIVVGGGRVAERKVRTLLAFGTRVRIVSPDLTAPLRKLVRLRRVVWSKRTVRPTDIKRANIVIAATSNETVNRKLGLWAKKEGALINVVDRARLSDFISPAIFRASGAVVAVYTHGADPVLSRDLKNYLKEHWDEFLLFRDRL